jgi:hypothetical protein
LERFLGELWTHLGYKTSFGAEMVRQQQKPEKDQMATPETVTKKLKASTVFPKAPKTSGEKILFLFFTFFHLRIC